VPVIIDRVTQDTRSLSVSAAALLLQARLTEISDARFAFVDEYAARVAQSNRLQGEANTAYSLALPVVVG